MSKPSSLRLLVTTPTPNGLNHGLTLPAFLETLTGSRPSSDIPSLAGYTNHAPLHLDTKYYKTDVSIWCDELPAPRDAGHPSELELSLLSSDSLRSHLVHDEPAQEPAQDGRSSTANLSDWSEQMTSNSAREVREVIGAIILVLPLQVSSNAPARATAQAQIDGWTPYIEAVSSLRDLTEDETGRDVASIAVLQSNTSTTATASVSPSPSSSPSSSQPHEILLQQMEDECLSTHGIMGWDFVLIAAPIQRNDSSSDSKQSVLQDCHDTPIQGSQDQIDSLEDGQRNEFGEKVGLPRVIEVLSGIDWFAAINNGDDEERNDSGDNDNDDDNDMDSDFFNDLTDIKPGSALSRAEVVVTAGTIWDTRAQKSHGQITSASSNQEVEKEEQEEEDEENESILHPILQQPQSQFSLETALFQSTNEEHERRATEDEEEESEERSNNNNNDEKGSSTKVDQLQTLMDRVMNIREQGSGMTSEQRRKFAQREIRKIMREL